MCTFCITGSLKNAMENFSQCLPENKSEESSNVSSSVINIIVKSLTIHQLLNGSLIFYVFRIHRENLSILR